jgi:hypothetical protein
MKKTIYFAIMGLALGSLPAFSAEVDCVKLSVSVKHAVAAERSSVLEVVSAQIAANPGCACEVVKAAIEGVNADAKTVALIVEAAAVAAPDQMRLISQCAVAVAPDALSRVQAVLAKLDPNKGEGGPSSKSAKSAVAEAAPEDNPLNFPGQGPIGPRPGGPGGLAELGPGADPGSVPSVNNLDPEEVVDPPVVTPVD